jgi:hypothetical protein
VVNKVYEAAWQLAQAPTWLWWLGWGLLAHKPEEAAP